MADREIVGLHIGPSEAETFWSSFLKSLARRGLRGVKLVIFDAMRAHSGHPASVRRRLAALPCGAVEKGSDTGSRPQVLRGIFGDPKMLGKKDRRQPELFVAGSLRELLPNDHMLVRVDPVLDLRWLRTEVAELYSADNGRPGIDPEVAVRPMVAGVLLGIVHDRRLMREAQVNLAIRWFIGYALHEPLPDHSSLTRIRQRWGAKRSRHLFERTVRACLAANIATGEIVHVDASLIRANVSWESLARLHVEAGRQGE